MDGFMLWGMGYPDSDTHTQGAQKSGGHNLLDLAASVVGNSEVARCACAQCSLAILNPHTLLLQTKDYLFDPICLFTLTKAKFV